MYAVKRLDAEDLPNGKAKAAKRKAAESSSSSSSSSSSDSDSDAPAARKPVAKAAPAPAKKKAASSSSSDSSSSSSDSDAPPPKKKPAPAAPVVPFKPVSDGMFGSYGFMLPSGAPPTAESLAREAAQRQAMLDAAAAAKAAEIAAKLAPPKIKQLSAKQAVHLSKVAKLNAAQAAKLDAKELEAYRLARAEDKKAKKSIRREQETPEERAQAKVLAKKAKKDATKLAAAQKAEAQAMAEAEPKPKREKVPKVVVPVVPSMSAATNPALRSEGLKKKDEGVRAAERAERKRARRIAMGLPAEEEVEVKEPEVVVEAPVVVEDAATSLHKRKLDEMRDARMAAVDQRDERDPLKKAMQAVKPEAPVTSVTVVAPSAAPVASEVSAALHAKPLWMLRGRQISALSSVALEDFALDSRIKGVLKKMGVERFFAAQSELLPVILKSYGTNDICCCAPTGSGKTLAYVLPLVQSLSTRILTRLRALILLPSRDLALQVLRVVQPFALALGLKVECILGQSSFVSEQSRLVARDAEGRSSSLVDILICTPGRLMDHLAAAEEVDSEYDFHLRDLQYLVVDEIDRLLTQGYQDWPAKILLHIFEAPATTEGEQGFTMDDSDRLHVSQRCVRRRFAGSRSGAAGVPDASQHLPLQKMLFSATLTNNPQKLQSLQLHNPLFFTESTSVQRKFQIPVNLKQWVLNMPDAAQKPIVLIHLLKALEAQASKKALLPTKMEEITEAAPIAPITPATNQTLIFTSSVESTHRLYRLLECYDGGRAFPAVAEFSSALTQNARSRILKKFQRGECKIIICSDAMARGMDLSNIDTVINYDVPTYVQTYVHRVGRTARAGSHGTAYTMVKAAQFRSFKSLLHQADNSFYSVYPVITDEAMAPLMSAYQHGLVALKNVLQMEKQGDQQTHQAINSALRDQLAAAAAAAVLESATEVDDEVDVDLEDKNKKPVAAESEAVPMEVEPEPTHVVQLKKASGRYSRVIDEGRKAKRVKLDD